MKICGKTHLNKNQILNMNSCGFTAFEIAVKEELDDPDFEPDFSLFNFSDIISVHCPARKNDKGTVIGHENWYNDLKRTCALAQQFSVIKNHDIIVVVHFADFTQLYDPTQDGVMDNIIDSLLFFTEIYPNVKIAIEANSMYGANVLLGREYNVPNNSLLENVTLARLCKSDRIGVVLDTRHMMIDCLMAQACYNTKDFMKREDVDYDLLEKYTYENYFKMCKDNIMLCHFGNTKFGTGGDFVSKDQWSIPFDKNNDTDVKLLTSFFEFYKKYNYDVPIIIEVAEKDYANCVNAGKIKECIDSILT